MARRIYVAEMDNGIAKETWTVVAPSKVEAKKKLEFLSGLTAVVVAQVAQHCVKRHWRAG